MTDQYIARGGIGYTGQVSLKVLNGHKVITEYNQHNEGLPSLMNGICKLLEGTAKASSIRPGYIAAYTLVDGESSEAPDPAIAWETLIYGEDGKPAQLELASGYCSLDLIKIEEAPASSAAAVTYSARIPYSLITSGKIYVLALLPQDLTNRDYAAERALACFRLANKTKWLPIICSGNDSESVLLVEWRLNFSDFGGTI
jgi:hypothetical protein